MKTSVALLLLFPILTLAQSPDASHGGTQIVRLTPGYLAELTQELRTNHPVLRALDARARASAHATAAVRTWEDPTFKFGGVAATDRGPKLSEDGNLVYGFDQKLPLFGKPAAVRDQARAAADVAVARQDLQFQILRRDLARALFETAYGERVLELGRQDLAWIETATATAEARYQAGTGSQVEVLRLQNERSKRSELLRTEALQRDHSFLVLNRLLGRELQAPWPRLELPDVAAPVPYSSNLSEHAVQFEPRLRVLARETASAEAQLATTRKARRPDVSAGIEGRQYSGDGGFREGLFTVSLSLPWFNGGKYRSDLARDRARLEAAQFDTADQKQGVREEVHHLTVTLDAARRQAMVYRDEIIPRSEQAQESAQANWVNNRGQFLDVMEARRMGIEARLMLAQAVSQQHQALHDLLLLCGADDFDALRQLENSPATSPPPPLQP